MTGRLPSLKPQDVIRALARAGLTVENFSALL